MKTVYLIRHAKSSWENPRLSDIERPLNKRGTRDAPFMAQLLYKNNIPFDAFISSPALRARTTAQCFLDAFFFPAEKLILDQSLYLADDDEILEVINELPNELNCVALFGHNPGMTYLANQFADSYIENVPTCGIVKLVSTTEDWEDLSSDNTILDSFLYPKQYFS